MSPLTAADPKRPISTLPKTHNHPCHSSLREIRDTQVVIRAIREILATRDTQVVIRAIREIRDTHVVISSFA